MRISGLSGMEDILGVSGVGDSQYRRTTGASDPSLGEDTVSFSPEALRLAEQMKQKTARAKELEEEERKKQQEEMFTSSKVKDAASEQKADGSLAVEGEEGGSAKAGGAGGGGGGDSSGDQISKIQKKIEELNAKLQTIMAGSQPEAQKQAMAAGIQQQIQELTQQLAEAQQEAAKS